MGIIPGEYMAGYGLDGPPGCGTGVDGGLKAGAYIAIGGAGRAAGAKSDGAAILFWLLGFGLAWLGLASNKQSSKPTNKKTR